MSEDSDKCKQIVNLHLCIEMTDTIGPGRPIGDLYKLLQHLIAGLIHAHLCSCKVHVISQIQA